jgi:cytochrome d ubiquinol oxidase subunit I
MSAFGFIDGQGQETVSVGLDGFVSWLLTGNQNADYPTLDQLASGSVSTSQMAAAGINVGTSTDPSVIGNGVNTFNASDEPIGMVFYPYHLMIIMWMLMLLWLVLAGFVLYRKKSFEGGKVKKYLLVFGPLIPFIAIQTGWMTAEIGRQPWVVYNLMNTADGVSPSVNAPQLWITIILFIVFYVILFIAWFRIVFGYIKKGPQIDPSDACPTASHYVASSATEATPAAAAAKAEA